ncbi:MAG: hypothetical protein KGL39_11750 [Patescibacteria group bacterium]|nr:hypothetical protein [Patescibacteria group bacterium]
MSATPVGVGGQEASQESPAFTIAEKLYTNRFLAHKVLFPHRHKNKDPEFHTDLMELLYSPDRWVAAEAFRGAAKSTRMEEIIILSALFGDFKYALILGNSYDRACERLAAIKNELITNDAINELFGEQSGGTWAADQIVLPNGCKIQAFGARQSLRGVKHNDERPDYLFVDDLEDEENVATEDARLKLKRWFNGALIPAMNPNTGKIRMVGTPLHPKSLLEEKMRDNAWKSARFPVIYLNEAGEEVSAWPDRFTIEYLTSLRDQFLKTGSGTEWEREYMCRPEDISAKPFKPHMIKVEPVVSLWMPVQIMVDPARTVKTATSARTGYAVWSWNGSKLYVHDAFGAFHKPDEIIKTIFELDDKFSPVEIGVEADGLEEFIMQPLRVEMARRGKPIPLSKQKAPRGKDDFIQGLQPFYTAGEVIHAKDLPDLVSELLQFPSGRKDVPNALAYALKMRVGKPVYEEFGINNIRPDMGLPDKKHPVYLAISARASLVCGVLLQLINGRLIIYKDYVFEGPPMEVLERLVQEAVMFADKEILLVSPKEQFNKYNSFGLEQAAKRLRTNLRSGAESIKSQGCLVSWIRKYVHNAPSLVVSDISRWSLNGFSWGYARKVSPTGLLNDYPEENIYSLVFEAIESFAKWADVGTSTEADNTLRYATTHDGRKYLTSRG